MLAKGVDQTVAGLRAEALRRSRPTLRAGARWPETGERSTQLQQRAPRATNGHLRGLCGLLAVRRGQARKTTLDPARRAALTRAAYTGGKLAGSGSHPAAGEGMTGIMSRLPSTWDIVLVSVILAVGLSAAAAADESPLGALEGVVRLVGQEVPPPTQVENTTDPAVCGRMQTLEDLLVSAEGGGIQNVIIALENLSGVAAPSPARLVLDNRGVPLRPPRERPHRGQHDRSRQQRRSAPQRSSVWCCQGEHRPVFQRTPSREDRHQAWHDRRQV